MVREEIFQKMYKLYKSKENEKSLWTGGKAVAIIRFTTKEVVYMLIAYGLVLTAVGMDLKEMRISNRLIVIGLGISLVYRWLCGGVIELLTGILQISFPVIVLYLLFLMGALGAGDIKLFSVIGGFVNFKTLVWCMLFAFLVAGIFSLGKVLWLLIREKRPGWHTMHFSVAILFGLLLSDLLV